MSSDFAADTVLSHYRIVSKIGEGGMGAVYLAHDTRLNRNIAVKVLPVEFAANQDRMRRFVQEAQAAAALNHPHIAQVYEIGEAHGAHYIAMELVAGVTLRERIHKERFDLAKVLKYLQQAAEGLSKAHAAGIVHRDLKPDNIMVTSEGFAKVLDFGLAKLIEQKRTDIRPDEMDDAPTKVMQQNSAPGIVMGTVGYMSPEQAQGQTDKIDHRSDVFSFGCILFECATGRLPFEGDSVIKSLHKLVYEPAPNIKEFNSTVPSALQHIVRRCLAKDPDERYQSIREVAIELKELRREMESGAEPSATSAPVLLQEATVQSGKSGQSGPVKQSSGVEEAIQPSVAGGGIRQHKAALLTALALVAATAVGLWFYFGSKNSGSVISSIAVMPFVNESSNADVEYLSDGMTETLIRSLSQLPKLNVKARSSVFRYKGKTTDTQTIGKELNVQAILNGRVVQRGDQLTLSLELTDVQTENVIWSERYDRKQADLVSLQAEIARDVSSKLKTKLSGAEEQKLAKAYTTNPEAYQHYLRGRFYWNKRNAENIHKAIEQFKAASEKDPGFALAYSGLADCYVVAPNYATITSSETLPSARAYATRAVEIDGSLAEAYASLGMVKYYSWDFIGAEPAFKRSIELNPSYPTAHHWYSRYLRGVGRPDEALAEIKRAKDLDPLSLVILNNLAENYINRGDLNSAGEECKRIMELDPNFFGAYQTLTILYSKQARLPEALTVAQKGLELSKRSNQTLAMVGNVEARSGQRDAAQAIIVELEKRYATKEADGRDLAVVYTGLGDKDKAFAWLEKSYKDHSHFLAMIRLEASLEPLHNDPRWNDLLRRVGLPQ